MLGLGLADLFAVLIIFAIGVGGTFVVRRMGGMP